MTPALLIDLNPPGAGNFQGTYHDTKRTVFYVPEAIKRDGREDTIVHRYVAATGKWDEMVLQSKPGEKLHFTGMGVLDDGTMMFTWNDDTGADLVELKYAPGKTVFKAAARLVKLHLPGNYQCSLSPTTTRIVLRRIEADKETYTRRATDDVRAGIDRQLGKPIVVKRRDDRVVQGFGVTDYMLIIATGVGKYPPLLEEYNFHTGKLVKIHPAGGFGRLTGEPPLESHELEGVQGDYVTVKVNRGADRRMRTFKHQL